MLKYDRFSLFRLTAWALLLVIFVYVLIVAKILFIPVALSLLVAFLLYPIARFLEIKIHFPRWLACLLSVLLAIAVIGTAVFFMVKESKNLVGKSPQLTEQVESNVKGIQQEIEKTTAIEKEKQDKWLNQGLNNMLGQGENMLKKALQTTLNTVLIIGLLPVYTFFILFYRNKFYKFIKEVISRDHQSNAEEIMSEISSVTKRYMTGILTVVSILCVLNSLGLYIVGAKYAILLGILSALLNVIPYFGTILGGVLALCVSFIIQGDVSVLVGIAILFVIIQFTENNILTPNITGGQVKLNPFITILSIVTGGLIWGIPGMFVSVPFLGMFKIVCEHVKGLQHISDLLGSQRKTEVK